MKVSVEFSATASAVREVVVDVPEGTPEAEIRQKAFAQMSENEDIDNFTGTWKVNRVDAPSIGLSNNNAFRVRPSTDIQVTP